MDVPVAQSTFVDDTMNIRFTNWARADLKKRQVIASIEEHEDIPTLEKFLIEEDLLIDAIYLFDDSMGSEIKQSYDDHKAMLTGWMTTRDIPKVAGSVTTHTHSSTKGQRMANPDFKKFVFKDVTFSWPRLDQPYRYNPSTEKSEACPANAQGAGYSLAWTMPYVKAQAIHAEMKAHYEDCMTRNSKLPAFSTIFGLKRVKDDQGNDTDMAQFTAKKGAINAKGNENKMPTVVNAAHEPIADRALWGGSKGHIRVQAFPSTNPQDKSGGVSLLLDAVVVTSAEYGSDGLDDDFGAPEEVDDLPESDNAPSHTQQAVAPQTAQNGATAGGF